MSARKHRCSERTFRLDTSAGFGKRASMRFRTPSLPLPVVGRGLSTTFLRAPCGGASRPADDSTDPEPPPLNERPAGVGPAPGTPPKARHPTDGLRMLPQLSSAAGPVHLSGRAPRPKPAVATEIRAMQATCPTTSSPSRSSPASPCWPTPSTSPPTPRSPPSSARDVTPWQEQAIIRCIAAAQPDLPLTPEWIAMCLDQARAFGEL
jgi:hypothetical protein